MNARSYVTPARAFFTFVFFAQFVGDLYAARAVEAPLLFDILSRVAFVWLVWWWLRDDSRQLGIKWILDLGMFLFVAWIVILPYHLFKTRGLQAFIPILTFILVALCGTATAVVVSSLF